METASASTTFYKVQADALLYMSVDRGAYEVPPETMTVTVMQIGHP